MEKMNHQDKLPGYELNDSITISEIEKTILDIIENNKTKNIYSKILLKELNKKYKKIKYTDDDSYLLLEYLCSKKDLIEKYDTILRVCPICSSNIITLKCQKCGGHHMKEIKYIIHICGHIDLAETFIKQDGLACPKCGEPLTLGEENYRYSDTIYRCMECGTTVNKYYDLDDKIKCEKCETIYRKKETDMITFYKINKNPNK